MKTNKLVSFALLLGLVFAGVSCKKENPQTNTFTMTPTTLDLKIGATGTITTANASGEITWTFTDDAENPVVAYELNDAKTACTVTALAEGTMTIKASNSGVEQTCTVNVTKEVIKTPDVAATDGKYTIAFRAPEISCEYPTIHLYGDFQGNNEKDPDAPVAELIEQEGFTNWYKIVFEAEDASTAKGKICPNTIDGTQSWNCEGKTYTLISGPAEIADDYGKQNKIVCTEVSSVVYVDVVEWAKDPCEAPNPQGTATFNVVVTTEFPDGMDIDDIEVSAAFWTAGSVEMTRDLSYTGEGYKFTGTYENYPANHLFKYNIRYKQGNWIFEAGDNRSMPYSLVTNDEVSEWDSTPWNPIPGGNGTFTITFEGDCYAGDNTEVVFTGSFSEESWENSNRIMTPSNGNQFTWTGEFPDNFEYKVIVREKDSEMSTWTWIGGGDEHQDNWKFDGKIYEQTAVCPAVR